jgi:hypothetical protein
VLVGTAGRSGRGSPQAPVIAVTSRPSASSAVGSGSLADLRSRGEREVVADPAVLEEVRDCVVNVGEDAAAGKVHSPNCDLVTSLSEREFLR